MPDVREHLQRHERLKHDRHVWEETWQSVSDHMLGRRDFNQERLLGGEQRFTEIYDTTGAQSAAFLLAAMHSLLTNPATQWFKLRPVEMRLLDQRAAMLWYEESTEALRHEFERPEARFQTQIAEVYNDEIGFGTAGLMVLEDPLGGVRFVARPISELFLAENALGDIDTVYCSRKMTARQIVQTFGAGRSTKADRLVAQNRPEERLPILHVIRPRDDVAPGRIDSRNLPWESLYISQDEKVTLRESGFHEKPLLTPRWQVDAGEVYGRSPAINALPDQKMLNEMSRTMIGAAQRALAPPVIVDDDSVLSQLDINPHGVNVARYDGTNREPIREIRSSSNFMVGDNLIQQRQEMVRQWFHSDLLAIFRDPRMTATQVLELAAQSQRLLSPTLGFQQSDLLATVVERTFGIALRQGRLPEIPDVLRGTEVKVQYQSPVVRAQRQSERQAIIEAIDSLILIGQTDPTVFDNVDVDEVARELWELGGVSISLLRSRRDVQELRAIRAEVQNQQAELDDASQIAEAAGKATPALMALGDTAEAA